MDMQFVLADGTPVVRAELGPPYVDVLTKLFSVEVWFMSEGGDVVSKLPFTTTLLELPIPSPSEQWALVTPAVEQFVAANSIS